MGCGRTCLKSSNLFLTSMFILASITEILFGTYILICMYSINRNEGLGQQYITVPSLTLVLFGIILLPLIILGCCGLCKEVACCVNLYSSVLMVLAVLQILVGVFAILKFTESNDDLIHQIKEDFTYSFKDYQNNSFVNNIQREMRCCGIISASDWKLPQLPSSCCADNKVPCNLDSDSLYKPGCVKALTLFIVIWNSVIGYSSIGMGCLEMFVALLGFALGCGSFRHYYKV